MKRTLIIATLLLLAGCGEPLPKERCELREITYWRSEPVWGWIGPVTQTLCVVSEKRLPSPITGASQ